MLAAKPHAFAGAVLCPKHARDLTPSSCLVVTSALVDRSYRKTTVPYTLWISEAWQILGWAEPSAALFWEMATMYHTLFLAATDFQESSAIPPILSCGSTSSMGSGNTHHTGSDRPSTFDKKKHSGASSAKELPVWLVGSFLLVHCEERAFHRNLSGLDDRRFLGSGSTGAEALLNAQGKVDFKSLLKHPSLSPRTRLHAEWSDDNSNCTVYLLRHLRKCLLLTAVTHNPDAVHACDHLASIPSPPPQVTTEKQRRASIALSVEEIHRQHDAEHGNVGLNVRLTMEDLERLHFLFQPPSGGGVDDPPMKIGEQLWTSLYSSTALPTATIPIGDVEREIRRLLEWDLGMARSEQDDKDEVSTDEEDVPSSTLASLSLYENGGVSDSLRAKQPQQGYQKELSYVHLRGTTILLKPTIHDISSGASAASGDQAPFLTNFASTSRLHDLVISDCSDIHMYLLQPFEHVTIAGCTGCTIVVGAVAGLLHVVDCEKTTITSAARRLLVSNCCDVIICVFTPSPPLLVGDNRNCQLAPYNTYYDGLREDLLATGLAAAAISENQSPYHGNKNSDVDPGWPTLQCASNKWKQPVELSKLEIPQVPSANPSGGSSSVSGSSGTGGGASRGADDKAVSGGKPGSGNDSAMYAPILLPPSEFNVVFVPIENESIRQRRSDPNELNDEREPDSGMESQYCRLLAEVLHLSPFRMPVEYERRALAMAERMRTIQQNIQKSLTPDQQIQFEEELNRGFRDWLVTSGNLRQVLDLVHLERRGAV